MAVLAYIVRDGMVLLIKRGFPPYRGFWSLPGGGTDPGEDPREACVREVKEETGLDVEVLEEVYRIRDTPIFSCKVIAGEGIAQPPETVAAVWFQIDEFIVPFIRLSPFRFPPFIKDFLEVMISDE